MAEGPSNKTRVGPAAVGFLSWLVPGAGFFLIGEKTRGTIVLVAITATFLTGLYVGSIGVIDPVQARPWYVAQVMTSPLVMALGRYTAAGGFEIYGKPQEIGQLYTVVAGLMNLLCVARAIDMARLRARNSTQ